MKYNRSVKSCSHCGAELESVSSKCCVTCAAKKQREQRNKRKRAFTELFKEDIVSMFSEKFRDAKEHNHPDRWCSAVPKYRSMHSPEQVPSRPLSEE